MESEQSGEQRKGERRWNQQQWCLTALENQVGQITPNDLCDCSEYEQQGGSKHWRRWW